jgi:hypothetical protein
MEPEQKPAGTNSWHLWLLIIAIVIAFQAARVLLR